MEQRIYDLPNAPLPLDPDSYYEVLVPDGSSATGYTSCKVKPSSNQPYKKYVALLSQLSTSAPSAVVLENTLGAVPVWSYHSTGNYDLTLSGAFTANKTFVILGQYSSAIISSNLISTNVVRISTEDASGGTPSALNGILDNTAIEIRVYP